MFRFWRASSRAQTLSEKLDAMLSRCFNPDEPGAAIIATKNGETLYRAAYGMADVARGVKLDPGMTFRLGSLTKQFTAVGVMMLAEQGKLVIQQDIRDFLPNLPFRQGEVITVEHLLTHTSGVRDYTALKDFADKMARDISRDALIDRFKDTPLQFEPGSKFAYSNSNSNYVLLGALIEQLSGQSYASFMAARIFEPLGLHDTAYEGHERGSTRKARGYSHKKPAAPASMTQPYAAGALVSTVDDLARWDAAISAGKLLNAESWKQIFSPFKLKNGRTTKYACGWAMGPTRPFQTFEHGGAIPGFVTTPFAFPRSNSSSPCWRMTTAAISAF